MIININSTNEEYQKLSSSSPCCLSCLINKNRKMVRTKRRNGERNGQRSNVGEERADTMGTNVYSSKDNQSLHKSLNGEFILYQILLERLFDENEKLPESVRNGLEKYFEPEDNNDRNIMKEFDKTYMKEM